ncbi:leucyl-tRNA synthetase [Stutzerimonas stutzeri]|uniref:Leucyl-tRNA synthetase n=1 Tax=Stutzerimonas stutzeri TaxID=316 RepID=W8RFA5_STUST|nr:leucyl-tRNA synthetase [Stutzerimonas stutzeri]
MWQIHFDGSFAGWREVARTLVRRGLAPHQLTWVQENQKIQDLFDQLDEPQPDNAKDRPLRVSRVLLEQLEGASQFRCDNRWALLYRILWRVAHGDQTARLAGDVDGSELHKRLKAVRREAHHLHAFLRFKSRDATAGGPQLVAWHEPAHDILASASGHFAERLGRQTWMIATPNDGVYWDGERLHHAHPCPPEWQQLVQETDDRNEALWLTYYGSTFNPARLNRSVLETNMPVRFWKHLPEGPMIPKLMSEARAGGQLNGQCATVGSMPGQAIGSKTNQPRCQNCPKRPGSRIAAATKQAGIVLLADQPGARPFGGAAGRLLDQAMKDAGLDRSQVHMTHAVKHFNHLVEIKARARRQLLMPSSQEVATCRPCLQVELDRVRPMAIVALGQTATQALLGEGGDFAKAYGHLVEDLAGRRVLVGDHPSEMLWNSPSERQWAYDALVLALKQAKRLSGGGA